MNHRTPLGPSLHTVVVHVNASSKLSKKLSANLEQHSTETECSAKCLRTSFKDYRRNESRYREQGDTRVRGEFDLVMPCVSVRADEELTAYLELEIADL